jgi:hypothetical protein
VATPIPAPIKLAPLKEAAARRGIPYSSARDMAFRGEIRIFRSGSSDRYARWYVDDREFDRLIESRMEKLA